MTTSAASEQTRAPSPGDRHGALPQIVHVIPYDGIGGVEIAASSVAAGPYPGFVFRKVYIASRRASMPRDHIYESGVGGENNPLAFLRTIAHLLRARPEILVLSLWRSCIVGMAVKLLRPRTRLVLFLHNTRHSNPVDALLTRMTARIAEAIWADSASTAAQRLGPAWALRARPISFLTARIPRVAAERPAPHFITWGRLHPRKRIEWALDFFALVHARHADARFTIIGPDRGEGAMLEAKVAALGLADAVRFLGAADMPDIARHAASAAFFVQTSKSEGMGMAVVEAMQMGLVPVVTPVGEIGSYVENMRNGVWFATSEDALAKVERLLADPAAFARMSDAAALTWRDRTLYVDEFVAACTQLAARPVIAVSQEGPR
ncbi:glycosyltransferase family 4 protein [Sphingomonas abietis]|uniref:Glycosyltransferase family 4 protein n=1 Tax=Sphingomonas abietis TaxID=3012344 RepID=A0ABY7NMT9_9SPHN|nr:glycosyltransferase family 4 protein [Sphingomonas abietis]WBO20826.1 glycosyltransferase family 4 protein [Sphingomonas abietis]